MIVDNLFFLDNKNDDYQPAYTLLWATEFEWECVTLSAAEFSLFLWGIQVGDINKEKPNFILHLDVFVTNWKGVRLVNSVP